MTRRQINRTMREAGWKTEQTSEGWCYTLTIPGGYPLVYRDKPLAVAEGCGFDLTACGPVRTQGGDADRYTVLG